MTRRSRQHARERVRVEMPSEQSGEPHHDAAGRRQSTAERDHQPTRARDVHPALRAPRPAPSQECALEVSLRHLHPTGDVRDRQIGIAREPSRDLETGLVRAAPLHEVDPNVGVLRALGITDSIVISFHLAFYAGIVVSFPLLLFFAAEFVLPALTVLEKKILFPAIAVSFALFLTGVLTCYFWLLPKTILFFFRDTQSLGWAPTWTVQQYYSFVTRFTIGFGLAFELPVVVLVLVRFGLLTYEFMARTRPYAIVLILILATIITPTPDVLTLIAMSLPMVFLYESCGS